MARITKHIYKCDMCGAESEREESVKTTILPIWKENSDGIHYRTEFDKVDLCETCRQLYINAVIKHFGEIKEDGRGVRTATVRI